jgi:hypothetical protein
MDIKPYALGIPFLKYQIDPTIVDALRLIKYEETEPADPDYLFLFEYRVGDDDRGYTYGYICVCTPSPGNDPRPPMLRFLQGNQFVRVRSLEQIKPKHDDVFGDYLAYVIE